MFFAEETWMKSTDVRATCRRRAPWGLDARLRGHDVFLVPELTKQTARSRAACGARGTHVHPGQTRARRDTEPGICTAVSGALLRESPRCTFSPLSRWEQERGKREFLWSYLPPDLTTRVSDRMRVGVCVPTQNLRHCVSKGVDA